MIKKEDKEIPVFMDEALRLTDNGSVVGRVGETFYLQKPGQPARLLAQRTRKLWLTAVNNQGQAVGGREERTEYSLYQAVIVQAGKVVDLNTRIPAQSGWHLEIASDINDKGQIVCEASRATDGTQLHPRFSRAVLLTPIPPPSKGR